MYILAAGMLSPCYNEMDPKLFKELPSSTNAVESYNRFSKSMYRQPLKQAMMATYKEDMAKTLEIIAIRKGLSVTYENLSDSARIKRSNQQNLARQKRYNKENDDPDGPPDTKKKFNSGMYIHTTQYFNKVFDCMCVIIDSNTTHKSTKSRKFSLSLSLKTDNLSGEDSKGM